MLDFGGSASFERISTLKAEMKHVVSLATAGDHGLLDVDQKR